MATPRTHSSSSRLRAQVVDLRFSTSRLMQHFSIPRTSSRGRVRRGYGSTDRHPAPGIQNHMSSSPIRIRSGRPLVPSTRRSTSTALRSVTGWYTRYPRNVAPRPSYLKESVSPTSSYWPEPSHIPFDPLRPNQHEGYLLTSTHRGIWNSGKRGAATRDTSPLQGATSPSPMTTPDIRTEMMLKLIEPLT